ncbi:MAG: 3'(2'),5'-bisphosphate nucleotidase [Planctomycetota bacterium]
MPYQAERELAIEAVIRACRLCSAVQATLSSGDDATKSDRSPVTVADYGAQAVVAALLARHFPHDPLVGEEEAHQLRQPENAGLCAKVAAQVRRILPDLESTDVLAAIDRGAHAGGARGRHWTLDPIDGTKGFLRREQYAVALALIVAGRVVLGVLGCPNLAPGGRVFVAVQEAGAFERGLDDGTERPMHVAAITDPTAATFCESVEAGHSSHDDAHKVALLLGVSAPPLRMDSQAKYGCVARGDAAIYLRLPTRKGYQEKIWDHAAGSIIVSEAGGKVTDCRGAPLDFSLGRTLANNTGVVATNGPLHERVLAAVRQVLAPS